MRKNFSTYDLLKHHLITPQRYHELFYTRDPKEELRFYLYLFAALGTFSLLFGAIFFVAANWDSISPFTKLLGTQLLLALNFSVAWLLRSKWVWFRLMLLSSAVLVGVVLAVIGQVYQTGADAFMLFTLWALLITPMAWFFKAPYLFLFWTALVLTAATLFYAQYLEPFKVMGLDYFLLTATLISHAGLGLVIRFQRVAVFDTLITPYIFQIIASSYLLSGFIYELFERRSSLPLFFILCIVQTGTLYYYYHRQKSITHLGLVLLFGLIATVTFLGKQIIHHNGDIFAFGLIALLLTYGSALLLIKLNRSFKGLDHA